MTFELEQDLFMVSELMAEALGHIDSDEALVDQGDEAPIDEIALAAGLDSIRRLASSPTGLDALEALLIRSRRQMRGLVCLLAIMEEFLIPSDYDWTAPEQHLVEALGGDGSVHPYELQLNASHGALADHLYQGKPPEQMPLGWCSNRIGPLEGTPGVVAVDIMFSNQHAGMVLWERFEIPSKYPRIHAALLFVQIGRQGDVIEPIAPPRARRTPELYRYHPERFEHYSGIRSGPIRVSQEIQGATLQDFQFMTNSVMQQMNEQASRFPMRERLRRPALASKAITDQVQLCLGVASYRRAGSQLFDLPPSLVEMLANTDVDQLPLSMLKIPYASLYIHFGPQGRLQLAPGFAVDGAYVTQPFPGMLAITITSAPPSPEVADQWSFNPAPGFTQSYDQAAMALSVGEAVDRALSDKIAGLMKVRSGEAPAVLGRLREEARDAGIGDINWIGQRTAQSSLDALPGEAEVYRQALRLVVNGLAYITAYPDDVKTEWASGTPKSMIEKAARPGKEGARAKSKLEAMGYRLVHLCGQGLARRDGAAGPGTGKVASHWVRGHWRNQAHGPGRTLRKMIWVMPYLVGDGAEEQPPGHLYLVS